MQPVSCKYLCTFWLGRRLPFLILRIQLINTILLSLQWWLFDAIKVWLTWVFCLRDGVGGTEARHGTSSARLRGELSQTWQRIEGPGRARHAATTQSGAALLIIGGHYAHRAGSSSAAVERSVVQPIPQQADSVKTPRTTHHPPQYETRTCGRGRAAEARQQPQRRSVQRRDGWSGHRLELGAVRLDHFVLSYVRK